MSVKVIKSFAAIVDFCDHLKSQNIPFYYFKVDQFYMFYENSDFLKGNCSLRIVFIHFLRREKFQKEMLEEKTVKTMLEGNTLFKRNFD